MPALIQSLGVRSITAITMPPKASRKTLAVSMTTARSAATAATIKVMRSVCRRSRRSGGGALAGGAVDVLKAARSSRRDSHLQNAVALIREEIVGLLDIVELETMRDERCEIDRAAGDHVHQPAHPLLAAGA